MAGTVGSYKIAFSPDLADFRGLGQKISEAIGQAAIKTPPVTAPDTSAVTGAVKKASEGLGSIPGGKLLPPDTSAFQSALSELKDSVAPAVSGVTGAFSGLKTAGAVGLAGVAAGVAAIVPEAIAASDSIDDFKASMQFAGIDQSSYEAAAKAADAYANATEYSLTDLLQTSAVLGSNGVKDYEGLAEAIGNLNSAAGGTAETYASVALVMGQAAGQGKIMTGDWNQLVNAIPGGASVLKQALQDAGAYTGDFKQALSDGQISADELFAAVQKLGSTDVAQQAAKSSTTFRGAWANMVAEIQTQIRGLLDSIKPEMTDLINSLVPIIQQVGPKIAAGLKIAFQAINSLVSFISANKDWLGPLTVGVLGFVGAIKTISTVASVFSGVSVAVKALSAVFTSMKAASDIISGVRVAWTALSTAFAVSPIGLVISLIAALVAGLAWFFTQTETGRQIWASFSATVTQVWQAVATTVTTGLQSVGQWITSTCASIKAGWDATWSAIGGFFKSIWDGIVGGLQAAIGWITGLIGGLKRKIIDPFINTASWLFNAGENLIKGLWNGIKSGASWLWGKITGLSKSIVSFFKKSFGIHSPSTVFRDKIGIFMTAGLGEGLLAGASGVYKTADRMATRLVDTLSVSPTATWNLSGAQQQLLARTQPVAVAPAAGYGTAAPQVTINQEVSKADSLIDVYLQTKKAAQGYFYRGLA